jgi:hypothetical protein
MRERWEGKRGMEVEKRSERVGGCVCERREGKEGERLEDRRKGERLEDRRKGEMGKE